MAHRNIPAFGKIIKPIFEKNLIMQRLLVIGHVWPEPNSSAAGSRMMQLLHFFMAENYEVHFATTAANSRNMEDLEDLGIKIKSITLNDSSFDDYLKNLSPWLVLFDRFMTEEQFGWRVDLNCPNTIKVLDTEDLHFLRKGRAKALQTGEENIRNILFNEDLSIREISAMYRCDLNLIISEVEMELLTEDFKIPEELLLYLPFLLDNMTNQKKGKLPSFEKRRNFVFIGNFLHEPNWDAVRFLKTKIWPEIRKRLPETELYIYGAYVSEKALQLNNPGQGFYVKGHAKKAGEVLKNARICLAPLRFGAGLKGKFIEAMVNGTPSITTPVGAEGINGKLAWGGCIAESPEDLVDLAVQLYSNKESWTVCQVNGFEIINQRFDRKRLEKELKIRISSIWSDLRTHRNRNFTGKMLKHHLHRSTYFMSKYIEEKNKK